MSCSQLTLSEVFTDLLCHRETSLCEDTVINFSHGHQYSYYDIILYRRCMHLYDHILYKRRIQVI